MKLRHKLFKDFLALGYTESEAQELAYLAENYNEPIPKWEDIERCLRILSVDLANTAAESGGKNDN